MSCTAAFNQKAFRGRADDGNETTANWKATQNTAWTQAVDENFRVRLEVQETAGCAKNNFTTIQLQYNLNSAGWVNVTATSNVVQSSASPNVADAAATTDQLTVGTGTFVGGGGFDEVNGIAGSTAMDVAASGHFEVEYCCQVVSADVVDTDTIQLRATDGGSAFAAYDATASLTVSESTPVLVTPGVVALTLTTFAPTVTASDHKTVTPGVTALTLTTFAPTVTVGSPNITVTPGTVALTITTFAPVVTASNHQTVIPGVATLTISTFAPTVSITQHQLVTPGTAALVLTTYAPSVMVSGGSAYTCHRRARNLVVGT